MKMSSSKNTNFKSKYLRQIPSIGKILEHPKIQNILSTCPRPLLLETTRDVIDLYKKKILSANTEDDIKNLDISFDKILDEISLSASESSRMSFRRVINATGDLLNDNFGHAPLSEVVKEALQKVFTGYSSLTTADNIQKKMLNILTGAKSSLVVNNNAAAIMLILNTLAKDKDVIISRGELIEDEGFRLPETILISGAKIASVGATNKTHLKDYSNAIKENTGAILKSRKGNYRIAGFSEEVTIQELIELGKKHNIPVIDNIGSGFLMDMTEYGFPSEPSAAMSVKYGADVVCLSGDKLLGGSQAGIIIASDEHISLMKKNPLYRAIKPGNLTIAILEATLRLYLEPVKILTTIPVLQFLTRTFEEIDSMTQYLLNSLTGKIENQANIYVSNGYSMINSVSISPDHFPARLISIKPKQISAEELAMKLQSRSTPIFVIVNDDNIQIDLRSVQTNEINEIIESLIEIFKN